jgi:glyoxylase-like metal-dependent hydrolase (beta-lactamase superfamily II)
MAKIGPWTLHEIECGRFGLDGGAMFGIVPKPLWEKRISADELNRIPLHTRCLLLESDDSLILIDNGIGSKYDEKFARIYAIDDEDVNLDASLAAAGFSRDDITDVVLTHLHFDHCGGSVIRSGDDLEIAFPDAMFHVQLDHWSWALEGNVREKASFLPENLEPLAESGQLELTDGRIEKWPGVELIPVDGHTKAMQLVKIAGPEHTLLYCADLLPTHAHLAPAWNMGYDLWPMTTIEEKDRLLRQAVDEGWHLFFEHDPTVGLADVRAGGKGPEITDPRPLAEL